MACTNYSLNTLCVCVKLFLCLYHIVFLVFWFVPLYIPLIHIIFYNTYSGWVNIFMMVWWSVVKDILHTMYVLQYYMIIVSNGFTLSSSNVTRIFICICANCMHTCSVLRPLMMMTTTVKTKSMIRILYFMILMLGTYVGDIIIIYCTHLHKLCLLSNTSYLPTLWKYLTIAELCLCLWLFFVFTVYST